MADYINHKNETKVYLSDKVSLDKEQMIDAMTDYIQKTSDRILACDPTLMEIERPDLMYVEDGRTLWHTDRVRRMVPMEMYTVCTIVTKRQEKQNMMNQMLKDRGETND